MNQPDLPCGAQTAPALVKCLRCDHLPACHGVKRLPGCLPWVVVVFLAVIVALCFIH